MKKIRTTNNTYDDMVKLINETDDVFSLEKHVMDIIFPDSLEDLALYYDILNRYIDCITGSGENIDTTAQRNLLKEVSDTMVSMILEVAS